MLDSNTPGNKSMGAFWGCVGANADEVIAAYRYMSTGKATFQLPAERRLAGVDPLAYQRRAAALAPQDPAPRPTVGGLEEPRISGPAAARRS
ncbi:MAG TPA: hypothetical protein PK324_02775, partial [Nocardioides sp.]|nr:hypothetical protein [Nocardioides sp.]